MQTETPQNAAYMVAAYAVTGLILGGYALWLWRRAVMALRVFTPTRDDR